MINKKTITLIDFEKIGSLERLSNLLCKDALISKDIKINVRKTGVNIDPAKLPNLEDKKILASHPNLLL